MNIEEMIKKLEEIKEVYGNIRVAVYDEYWANEGWNIKEEQLYSTAWASVQEVPNTKEMVVQVYAMDDDDDEEDE